MTKEAKGVILSGWIELPKGETLPTGKLIPVEITLVSKAAQWKNRNERIVAIKRADPSLSCQSIAALVGVTRQRVHQILKVNGKTVKRRRRKIEPPVTALTELEEM